MRWQKSGICLNKEPTDIYSKQEINIIYFQVLILCTFIGLLNAEVSLITPQDIRIYNNNEIIAASPLHLSNVTNLIESQITHTDNFKMDDTPRNLPHIKVTWNHKATISIHTVTGGDRNIEITKIELRDYGTGNSDIGDIMILCFDADNHMYHCEKYSPQFCDAVDSILRFKVIK